MGPWLKDGGLRYQFWSELDGDEAKNEERVVVINAFGELFELYGIGTVVFCGASLVPL